MMSAYKCDRSYTHDQYTMLIAELKEDQKGGGAMSCDPFEWTCARCGKTYSDPFFMRYPREFWKDNKKHVGEVCEECRGEVDYNNVRRRKAVGL